MDIIIKPAKLAGKVDVIDSKSEAHRKLICSLLAFGKTAIDCKNKSEDIKATIDCMKALGAEVYITTVDGSYGTKGFVTDVLKNLDYSYYQDFLILFE